MSRWPEHVKDAVREAHAAGMGPSETLRKLHAGNLFHITEPTLVPLGTLERWWAAAKRARRKALTEAPECPTCGQPAPGLAPEPEPEGGSLLEDIARDIEERERREAAEDADPASAELHPTMGGS